MSDTAAYAIVFGLFVVIAFPFLPPVIFLKNKLSKWKYVGPLVKFIFKHYNVIVVFGFPAGFLLLLLTSQYWMDPVSAVLGWFIRVLQVGDGDVFTW